MVKIDRKALLLLVAFVLLGALVLQLAAAQPTSPQWESAVKAVQDHDWQSAASDLEQVIQADPDFAPAHYFLGRAYMGLQRYSDAVKEFDAALGLAPLAADANYYKAKALEQQGDILQAIDALQNELSVRRSPRWPQVLIELAEANMMAGRIENARVLLEQILEMEPSMPRAYYDMGLIYYNTDKPQKALDFLLKAQKLMKEYERADRERQEQRNPMGLTPIRRGQVSGEGQLLQVIRDEDFVQQYYWAIDFDKEGYWPYLYEALARTYMKLHQYSTARATLRELTKGDLRDHAPYSIFVYPNHSPVVHNLLGKAYILEEKNRLARGLRVEYRVLEGSKNPYITDPVTGQLKKAPPSSAKEELDLAIKQAPDYPEPYLNLGDMYEFYVDSWSNPSKAPPYDYDDAIEQYKKALEHKPDYEPAVVRLAGCYYKEKKYNQALQYLQQAMKLNPNDYLVHKYLGLCTLAALPAEAADVQSVAKNLRAGIASLERSLQLKAGQADVHNALGKAYERLSAVTNDESLWYLAVSEYQKATRLDESYVEAYINLGRARLAKNWSRAGAPLQTALKLLPESSAPDVKRQRAQLHYLLGVVDYKQGRRTDALNEYKKALALRPDLVPAQLGLARIYNEMRQYLAAEEAYKQALDVASDPIELANAHYLYGQFLEQPDLRRPFDAVTQYSAALALDPTNEQAKQALDRLVKNSSG